MDGSRGLRVVAAIPEKSKSGLPPKKGTAGRLYFSSGWLSNSMHAFFGGMLFLAFTLKNVSNRKSVAVKTLLTFLKTIKARLRFFVRGLLPYGCVVF